MSARRPLRAITFDYWNTLVSGVTGEAQHARRAERWQDICSGAGVPVDADRITAALQAEWEAHQLSWASGQLYSAGRAAHAAVDRLAAPIGHDVRAALVDAFCRAGADVEFELMHHVSDVLPALRDAGVRVGIICDVGFTPSDLLRDQLQRHGLLDCFVGWSFSDEVGCYKPGAAIFAHALAYLGTTPEETAHIGDIRRTDVAGAKAAGFFSIRYNARNDDLDPEAPEGDLVIDDHRRLPPLFDQTVG